MSTLIRLYPAAWRERYEAEFLDLLEARPPTVGDRFDIVRGAIDARLHPQVRRPEVAEPSPLDAAPDNAAVARRLGYGALAGAAVWILAWWVASIGPVTYDGYGPHRDGAAAFPFILLSVFLLAGGLVGQLIRLPSARRVARLGAVGAIPFMLMWGFAPWWIEVGALAMLGLLVFSLGSWGTAEWSTLGAVAVLGGCTAVLVMVAITSGLIGDFTPGVGSEELVLLMIAAAAAPIWLGVGGTLVARPRATSSTGS
jgi:hypothetical protein